MSEFVQHGCLTKWDTYPRRLHCLLLLVVCLSGILLGLPNLAIGNEPLSLEAVSNWANKGRAAADREEQLRTGKKSDGSQLTTRERTELERKNTVDKADLEYAPQEAKRMYRYAYLRHKRKVAIGRSSAALHSRDKNEQAKAQAFRTQYENLNNQMDQEFGDSLDHPERGYLEGKLSMADLEAQRREHQARVDELEKINNRNAEQQRQLDYHKGWVEEFFPRRMKTYEDGLPSFPYGEDGGSKSEGPTREAQRSQSGQGMGNGPFHVTVPYSGLINVEGGEPNFNIEVTGGYRMMDETPERFLREQEVEQGSGTNNEEKKTWSGKDSQSSLRLEWNYSETFHINYGVEFAQARDEAEVFVSAGYGHYLGEWSTFIKGNYAGMGFENIEIPLDVTPTYTTSLLGKDPWDFKTEWAGRGADLTRWEGQEFPFGGGFLQWPMSRMTFDTFVKDAQPFIQYIELDPVIIIAPAPSLNPSHWPDSEAQPIPNISVRLCDLQHGKVCRQ